MYRRVALAAAMVLSVAGSANAATLINGSFESGPNPGSSFVTLGTGDSSITGWTVSAGSIDYIGGYWPAQDGSRSIDLAGLSLGTLSQTIADTVAGQAYTILFYASKNPDGGDPNRTGTISFGGNSLQFAYGLPNDRSNMNWTQYTYNFVATGPNTVLSFAADQSAGCCYGPALDNVRIINAVPEPSTWAMMLVGFGTIGFGMRRRKGDQVLVQRT